MSRTDRKVIEEALRLPAEARAALAGRLLRSLDREVDEEAEAAWDSEIARRIQEIDRGDVKTIPWPKARRMIRG